MGMQNINGGLGFAATLDIDDFNVSADAMERHVRNISTNIQAEAADMEQSMLSFAQKGAMYIQTYLAGQGMMGLLSSIVQVRGQFQQLEIAFGTMLGSEEKTVMLMNQMANTAAKTPYDLTGVAEGAKQLLAYGESVDKVNDTLVRLGNIASGLSIPLNDIVYLYGTTMVQGRLYAQDVRQFTGRGIPLVKELAEMYGKTANEINDMVSAGKIGFEDVQKVLYKLTNEGGQFYNLMEKQSASLTGQISNLEDAWDSMLNRIGNANQGIFSDGISGATYLVENYQKIIDILKAVALGYGSVKAAIVLNTLATKGYTGVALVDNTVRAAKVTLMKAEAVLTGETKAQVQAMTAARTAHVASLQAEMTAEELSNLNMKLRIATISQLLTAQQQEYLSNLGLTTSSQGYEAAAMQVLSVDQQLALKKIDLSSKSALYVTALEGEVAAKRMSATASLEEQRASVKAAAARLEEAKQAAVAANAKVNTLYYEIYMAKQNGETTKVVTLQKKLEAAEENKAISRKAALAASTDFYTKKKALEATATRTSTAASAADTSAKASQTAATGILSSVTHGLSAAFKSLWATMLANPFTALLSLVGMAISAFMIFKSNEEETMDAMGEFNNTTGEQIAKLETYLRIVQSSSAGTKVHKDALSKINEIAKEYNQTLLTENDTLDQQEKKYKAITTAIQETTAEKIKAKYTEQALTEMQKANAESLDNLREAAKDATYKEITETIEIVDGVSVLTNKVVDVASGSIRGASGAVWDAVESMALDAANNLKNLTGEAYTQAFNQSLNNIVALVQKSTGASDKEMEAFSENLSTYLSSVSKSANNAQTQIDKVDKQLDLFFSKKPDATNIVSSTDYVSMSFEDLDKKIKENQDEIDKLNAKIIDPKTNPSKLDALKAKLQELLGLQAQLNGAVTTKTNNLNTDEGIQARIKALREENATLEYGNKKRAENAKQILQLQEKMDRNNLTKTKGRGGSRSGSGSAVNSAEQLAQKQLEAQRKLEDARIAIMQDGYEKRKAMLDLEHKRKLDAIDKEEKELEKARKKAGKGSLTNEEKQNFNERRKIETKSYDTQSTKLFDAEIEYRKKQYDSYWQWVRNVGVDTANEHFKDLIKEGTSFSVWVEQQISALEAKKSASPGEFTDADANALNSLSIQKNEIIGAKSAMDLFRESLTKSIAEARTLAEKLQVVANMKDKLVNGEFHLNQDETTTAAVQINQEDSKIQEEIQNKLLSSFQTYEEKVTSIKQEHELLRNEAMKSGNAERIKIINESEEEALSTLNAEMLKQSDAWKQLFEDLDALSANELASLLKNIQDQLNNSDLKLSPVDYKALVDSLDKARNTLIDKNPFKAIGQFYDSYIAAKKRLAEAKANVANGKGNDKDVKEAETDMKKAAKGVTDSIKKVTDVASDCGNSLADMFDALGMDGLASSLGTATQVMGQLGNAAASVGKIMSGDILGGATGMISAVTSVVSIFAKLHDAKYEKRIKSLQDDIDKLEASYSRLERAYDNTYWVFTDAEKQAYEKNLSLIQKQIDALEQERQLARKVWDFGKYATLTKQINELKDAMSKAKENGDMFTIYEEQKRNLIQQQADIRQQIYNEKQKKKTDNDRIKEWETQIESINQKIEDLDKQMKETLAGTSVQSAIETFGDALVEAYCKGENAADALGEKTKEVLKKAVVDALKRKFLAKAINDAVDYLGEAMQDSVLTDEERSRFTFMVQQAGETFNNALAGIGDWIKNTEETSKDAATGAVQSLSEDTGGIIAGRMNAAIINQGEQLAQLKLIAEYTKVLQGGGLIRLESATVNMDYFNGGLDKIYAVSVDMTGIMRQHLEYQAQIAWNTAHSSETLDKILKRMETDNRNSLLAYGIQ